LQRRVDEHRAHHITVKGSGGDDHLVLNRHQHRPTPEQFEHRIGCEVARHPGDHIRRVIPRITAVQGGEDDPADPICIGGLGNTNGDRHALSFLTRIPQPPPY